MIPDFMLKGEKRKKSLKLFETKNRCKQNLNIYIWNKNRKLPFPPFYINDNNNIIIIIISSFEPYRQCH